MKSSNIFLVQIIIIIPLFIIIITKLENILLVPTKLKILQPHENQRPHANKCITVNITHSINYYFQ